MGGAEIDTAVKKKMRDTCVIYITRAKKSEKRNEECYVGTRVKRLDFASTKMM